MGVKAGDRYKVNDRDQGTLFGTVGKDTDETDPAWPMVPFQFDGEPPIMVNITHLTLVPKDN